MVLEILLVRDGGVRFRLPLDGTAALPLPVEDSRLESLSDYYSIGANWRRLKVLLEFARGRELRFSDVMQIATNPKIAQDCLRPLLNGGFILHGERGSTYKASSRGFALGLMMTFVLSGVLDEADVTEVKEP